VRRFLDRLITGLAIAFAIPTILILISWNAIPGGRFYPIKTELEDITLVLTANTPLAPALSLKFTDRRFNEATILLAREGSSVGYELLVAEAKQTQAIVLDKQDVKNGSQFIDKIEEYQAEIEKKQIEIQSRAAVPVVPIIPTPTPKEEEPEEVLLKLEETQEELEEIKERVKKELPETASERAKERHSRP